MKNILEYFGWFGALLILLGYISTSTGLINSSSIVYQVMNAVGAIGILSVSIKKKAYQPAVVNAIWLIVALFAIVKALL